MLKRTLIILTSFLGAIALLWAVSIQTAQAAPSASNPSAPAAADVVASIVLDSKITSPTNMIQVGDTFTVRVRLDSASNVTVSGISLALMYDPTIITATDVNALWLFPETVFGPGQIEVGHVCVTEYQAFPAFNLIYGECANRPYDASRPSAYDQYKEYEAAPFDAFEITFEARQTNVRFDLIFDTDCSDSLCMQVADGNNTQVLQNTINATNTPLAVTLSDMGISPDVQSQGAVAFAVLMFVTTAVLLYHKRREMSQ